MQTRSALLALLLATGIGCAHKNAEPRVAHHEHEHAVASHGDWTKLGERWVDGVRDHDVITVGAHEGHFRRMMIVVEHSALEMFDVVVTFGDGTSFSPPTRHVFSADSRSHVIDLPGNERIIRTVAFRYGNLPGGGRAQAEVWAQ